MSDTALLVMVKAPLPGLVKTRLAAAIGPAAALCAYRAMVGNVLAAVDACGLPASIVYTPGPAHEAVAGLCGPARRCLPQAPGDLGARMAAALARAFADGAKKAVLLGSDLPLVTPGLLRRAAHILGTRPAVLGPADDGGYWLIGFGRDGFLPEVFTDMPWSTPAVAALTLDRLAAAGRRPGILPRLPDCDTPGDLARLAGPPWREQLEATPFGRFLAQGPAAMFDQNPGCR